MKTLIIAEKPSVARDIAEALGGEFTRAGTKGAEYLERDDIVISSAIGHLVGLECPKEQDPGYDLSRLPAIPDQFSLTGKDSTATQLKLLGRLMNRNDIERVVNACDAGREGELIFRYIAIYCDCRKPIYRMWLQSMMHAAILDAYTNMEPAHYRDNLFFAAQCRSEADWLIGVNGSRGVQILYKMISGKKDKHTVGRVQTPTLNILVERELAVKSFVAKDYYEVISQQGTPGAGGIKHYIAKWTNPLFRSDNSQPETKADRFLLRQQADAIAAKCRGHNPSSITDDSKEITSLPPKLFDLTTLQREANKRFGFTANGTLKLAQALYEKHKVLTYPRTDASVLPDDYVDAVQRTLSRIAQTDHALAAHAEAATSLVRFDKRIFNTEKISDHFAIIPTGKVNKDLTPDEATIFDLVLRRFISAFLPAAIHYHTVRTTMIAGETFRTTGRVLVTPGWLSVYGADPDEETQGNESALCHLAPGEILPTTSITVTSLKTRPPKRFTEAMLLGAMETAGAVIEDEELREAMKARGLGTVATRASTIEHLVDTEVGYVVRQKKLLMPTQKGIDLIAFLKDNSLAALTATQTTGEWEFALLQMEQGKYTREVFMGSIHKMAHNIIERIRQRAGTLTPEQQAIAAPPAQTHHLCPRCRTNLIGDANSLVCQCGFKLWKNIAGLQLTDDQCETLLTSSVLPTMTGFKSSATGKQFSAALKLGEDMSGKVEFVFEPRTSSTTVKSNDQIGSHSKASPPECPLCQKPMRQRVAGGKAFWGCTGYPTCKKTIPQ